MYASARQRRAEGAAHDQWQHVNGRDEEIRGDFYVTHNTEQNREQEGTKGEKYPCDLHVVFNTTAPAIPKTAELKAIAG